MPLSSAFKTGDVSQTAKKSGNPFLDFQSETSARGWPQWPAREEELAAEPRRSPLYTVAAVGVGLVVGLSVSAIPFISRAINGTPTPEPAVITESAASFTSAPAGAAVYIDGTLMGETPLSLSLPVGVRAAEVRSGVLSRRMAVTVEAGKIVTQHVDFGALPATGAIEVSSDPAGAAVAVNGTLRGVTPLALPELAPGAHRVTVSSGSTSIDRTVEVTAGATANVFVSVPRPVVAPQSGWVTIDAPIELDVFEGGRHISSGRASRIPLPAGRHTLEVVNRQLGFRTETTVTVPAGRAVAVNVPMPTGTLSISALPWADVFVDGRSIGQTPIGNLSVSLGAHEVIWRHPSYGERRQMVLVSATEPVRLGIDWTR